MTYSGNQLTNVADAGTTVTIAESNDFKKGSSTNPGYAYNKNGAMTKDLNKNISSISYNFLNLPARVSISGVHHDYTYSADGRKLKVVQGNLNRDYVGGVIYETGSLKRILIDGGYIEGTTYHYYLNDHQGNIRVVASGTGTIHQRNHYYPFGMPFADTNNTDQDKQPYKYGGKEYERANGLKWFDFESRQMDPAFGRFTTMDPLAEKYYGVSPYAYCGNNPIRYIDPTGMKWKTAQDEEFANILSQAMTNRSDEIFGKAFKKYNSYRKALADGNTKKADKIKAEMQEMGENLSNMQAGVTELAAMGETTDQIFTFNMVEGDVGSARIQDGVIVMDIVGKGSIANGVHESSHGFDIWKSGMPQTVGSFYSAETKAYGRQFSFGGKSVMPSSEGGKVNRLGDVTTNWVIGITDSKGDYMYPKQLLGDKYNKAQIKSLLFKK